MLTRHKEDQSKNYTGVLLNPKVQSRTPHDYTECVGGGLYACWVGSRLGGQPGVKPFGQNALCVLALLPTLQVAPPLGKAGRLLGRQP